MAASTILLIRHAEKPPLWGAGVDDQGGGPDPESLAVRGWQRAGAWAELFAPSLLAEGALPRPDRIFASRPAKKDGAGEGSKSRRPEQTVVPLALKLGLDGADETYMKGQEAELAAAILPLEGVTLVCWQHEKVAAITAAIPTENPGDVPGGWPDDRYNPVLRFRRAEGEATWTFDQLVPVMLAGDSAAPL